MYHYVLRAPYHIPQTIWAEVQGYWDYVRYKSVQFDHLQDMVDNYKWEIEKNFITPNPEFYYNGKLMTNSDDVYYGYDIIEEPLSQQLHLRTESELVRLMDKESTEI